MTPNFGYSIILIKLIQWNRICKTTETRTWQTEKPNDIATQPQPFRDILQHPASLHVSFCQWIISLRPPPSLCPFASCLCGRHSIMQNKANVKMGNINISTAKTKAYANEQRTINNERYPKQSQTNPIPPPPSFAGRESRISERNAYPDLSGQHQRSRIQYQESRIFPILLCIHGFIAQNKANVKMGNINISTARTKAYPQKQRTMNNERHSKQTQSNPILPPATRFCPQKRTSPDRFLRRICARSYRRILHPGCSA